MFKGRQDKDLMDFKLAMIVQQQSLLLSAQVFYHHTAARKESREPCIFIKEGNKVI